VPRSLASHRRPQLGIAALAGVAVLLVSVAYGLSETERQDVQQVGARLTELRSWIVELTDAVHDQEIAVDDMLISGSTDRVGAYDLAVRAEKQSAEEIRTGAFDVPGLQPAVTALQDGLASWRQTYADPAIGALQRGSSTAPFTARTSDVHEELDARSEALSATASAADVALRARVEQLSTSRTAVTTFVLAVALVACGLAMWLIRRYGRALEQGSLHAGILNRFTEVTSFASDDTAVAASNLEALSLLVNPDAAVVHVLNRSKDRAVPEAVLGAPIAEVLSLHELSRCAGVLRGSMFVVPDAGAPLSVHCPVYPVREGTLACVPLTSGEWVGTVHLYWKQPQALGLDFRSSIVRIAEHAALAIANRRMLAALQGQANTDPRTGLANSRAFDLAVEEALMTRRPEESLAVLMLDLDNFKDFNDRHGHPAGDEALRAFARVLESCMRQGDLCARYGGEEFAVLLSDVDLDTAKAVAERIRGRTDSTILSLAPGVSARISVSIGVALGPEHAATRVGLLRVADQALYRAKTDGRNRVAIASAESAFSAEPGRPEQPPDAVGGSSSGRASSASATATP
jgi:diguanylate cyclase (GGDEF)-like protein